jgi:hypothetical protein
MELRFASACGHAEYFTDLVVCVALNVVQYENFSCAGWQTCDGAFKVDRKSWRRRGAYVAVRHGIDIFDRVIMPSAPPVFRLTVVEDDVHRETMEPGAERAVPAKLVELFPCPHKCVLRQFFGAGAIADHSRAQRKNPVDVLPIQPLERKPVPARRASDIVLRVSVDRFNHAFELQGCSHLKLILFVSLVQMVAAQERFEVPDDTFRG